MITHFSSRKFYLSTNMNYWGFRHISIVLQYHMWNHFGVGIIQFVLLGVPSLVFIMVMVKVVWVILPSTFPPIKLIVVLMVVILCHLVLVIIQP